MKESRAGIFIQGMVAGILGSILAMLIAIFALDASNIINMAEIVSGTSGKYGTLEKKILNKVNLLETYINKYFLDEINEETMADSIYKGLINGLGDEYAAYYTKKEYEAILESSDGTYCGIGAYLTEDQKAGTVTIVKPMKESPAEKAGIQAGDIIYAVDGKKVSGMEISQVQALVKGEPGTKVKMTLLRGKKHVDVSVIRAKIEEDTVAYQMLDNSIGYIQVASFEQVTSKQFNEAVDTLEKKGEKGLIIDLRNNGGGLLDTAVSMLDRMLPEGVVVYSKDKQGNRQEYMAKNPDKFDKPLAILVNEYSASASEVFSGALQEKGTGKLVGTQTFGKGIVQGIFGLSDGSAVKMTTAKYYTPGGRNIHGKGLEPDIKVKLSEKAVKLPNSGKKVDTQLKKAWRYLNQECSP